MTLEQALMSALSVVTSALVVVVRILWKRSEKCETDRYELRKEIEEVKAKYGHALGQLEMYNRCPVDECPFRPGSLKESTSHG
jgi:hypothetical protein